MGVSEDPETSSLQSMWRGERTGIDNKNQFLKRDDGRRQRSQEVSEL